MSDARVRGSVKWAAAAAVMLVGGVAGASEGSNASGAKLASLVEPGGLTSAEVARRAASTSFDARAKEEGVRAAAARVDQALVSYFPRLGLTARYTRLSPLDPPSLASGGGSLVGTAVSNPTNQPIPLNPATDVLVALPANTFSFPVFLNQYYLQASVGLPLSDYVLRISQGYAAASRSESAAKLDLEASRRKAALDGRVAFYSWVRAKAQVIVAEQAVEQARGHLADARHAFEVGTASKADVLRVESQVAMAEMVVERAKNLSILVEEQLRTAMHDDSAKPYAVGEDVLADVEAPSVPPLEDLRAEAMEKRLEVRALDETIWSLRESVRAVRAGTLPRLDAFGDYYYANPNSRVFPQKDEFKATWDVGVQLTWSPNDTFSASGVTAETEAKTKQVEAQKSALRDGIRLEVVQAAQAVREATVGISTSGRGLAAAEEGYRVRRELFRNGRATSAELTDAESDLLRARLEDINARADLRVARAKLEHAVGRDAGR